MKYVRVFSEGKEKHVELTPKGLDRILKLSIDNIKISRPKIWDKKWRVVIFDVPEKKHYSRDMLRNRLVNIGFVQIQKSVYVFPFECTNEIAAISTKLLIENNVTIMLSDIIQGEDEIINKFIDNKILSKKDLI